MSRSRISFLDVAKGIAMISIILGHTHVTAFTGRFVFTYHVPVFLLITGYFINQKKNVLEFTKKRLRALMLPYFVTCAIIILINSLRGLRDGTSLIQLINWSWASVYGSGNAYQTPFDILSIGAIWFLPASCIAAILLRCILLLPHKWHPMVVSIFFTVGYLSSKYLFWFPMSVQAGCCSVLFLYFGWLFRENEEQLKALSLEVKVSAVLVGTIVWIFYIIDYSGYYVVRNFYGKSATDTFCVICACGIMLLISYGIDRKTKILGRLFRFAGRYSLLVLCVHGVEQNVIKWKNIIDRFVSVPDQTFRYIMAFYRPAVILFVVWLLLKIPFIRRLFGYDRVNA